MSQIEDLDLVDVSSEDDEQQNMAELMNNLIEKIKDAPKEKIEKLNKLNDEVLKEIEHK